MILTTQVMELQEGLMLLEEYLSKSYIRTRQYRIIAESSFMFVLKEHHPYTYEDIGGIFNFNKVNTYKRIQSYKKLRVQYPQHAEYLENLSKDIIKNVHNNQRKRLAFSSED